MFKIFNEYELIALRYVWNNPIDGVSSGDAHKYVNNNWNENKISRASIINFLNSMVEKQVLRFIEKPGKGGMRRIYYPILNEGEYKMWIIRDTIQSFMNDFPEETQMVLQEFEDTAPDSIETNRQVTNEKKKSLKDIFTK